MRLDVRDIELMRALCELRYLTISDSEALVQGECNGDREEQALAFG